MPAITQSLKGLLPVIASNDFVILDTETTGLGVTAEVCEIAILHSSGEVLLNTRVKPLRPVHPGAAAVHGISTAVLQVAPGWELVAPKVQAAITGKALVIYNAGFDIPMLYQSSNAASVEGQYDWESYSASIHCAMLAYAEFYGEWNDYRGSYRWQKLTDAVQQQRIKVKDAHTALGDCRMTLEVCRAMLRARTAA